MQQQLDVSKQKHSIKDDNLEKPQLRFPEFKEHWKISKLNDLFNFSVAGDMNKELFNNEKNNEYKYPLFANALENEGLLGYYKEYKYEPNSITITARGNIGHAIVRETEFNAIGRLIILTKKQNINMDFFTEYINNNVKIHIESTGVPQLTAPSLKINKVKYPNIIEQNKIADFLKQINIKIDLLEKTLFLYQKLEEKIRKDIFNFKENLIDFKKHTLEDIADIRKGFTPSTQNEEYWENGTYKWLSIADMDKKYLSESSKKITAEAIKHKNIIPKDTLIMSFKLSIGKLAILKEPMFTNEAIANFTWKTENISTEYMYYYLKTINILKYGSQAAKGVTLNNDSLNSIPILLPSYENQKEIVKLLKVFEMKIELIKSKLEKEKEFKKGILQKMFI